MASNSLDFLLNLRANTTGFDQGINGAKFAVNALVGAMAALGVGLGVKELAEAADSYATLSARIQQATKDGGNFEQAMSGVHQIALQTNSTLDNTGALFTRLNTVAKDMGKSQQFALDMTSTVTKAIQLGGSSTQEAEAAVTQFIQAMQGGVLRGEEFNSIMEGGYGLAEALAKGLGKTTGELRKMAENGELSAERVLAALEKQKAGVDAQYAEMPTTISNALQKISTSWQILIGEMDQANGASATVAQWLSVLADNMGLLKLIIDDIGNGFTKFGAYLSDIYDQGAIDSLKTALGSIYDTIKTLFNTVLDVGRAFNDVFDDALSGVFSFTDGLRPAGVEVSGLQKAFDSLNIAINLIGDGFKAVGVVTNLFAGTLYRLAAVWYEVKATFTWGDVKEQAIANITAMQNKSDEYFTKGFDGIKNYESQTIKSIENMGKTEDQKNAERIANNQKALADLKAQEAQHVADYKAISDERIKLQQQLVDARKSGDQSAIDAAVAGLAELDKKEKAYQAESKKISDEKIKAAQDWASAQIEAATKGGVALSSQTKKTIEAQIAAQGLAVEFDKTGKAIVKAIEQEAGAAVVSLETRLGQGRKAAEALGLDLDVALNKVSDEFKVKATALDTFTKNLELMGVKGSQAADVTYEAWSRLLEKAKSQAEIDAAQAKFKQFEEQGVFSTKQVEMGMLAIRQQTQKLPDDLDETGKAFERLGIKTKEQLKLAADVAIADFNRIQASGQATTEGLKQAYERVLQAAVASGDQSAIAATKAKAASLGLQVQIDESGKASVKSMNELSSSLENVGRTASGSAAQGFRQLGRVAKQEAEEVAETWEQAMSRIDKQRKAQAAETAKGLGQMADGQAQMAQDFYNQLIAGGMEQGRAEALKKEAMTRMNNQLRDAINGGTAQGRIDAMTGRNASVDWMDNILKGLGKSGSVSTGVPKTPSTPNIQPPEIPQIKVPNIDTGSSNTVTYKFEFGGKQFELQGAQSQQSMINEFFNELEQAKKRY
ncbi:tape measure protein [Acinetobacter corruptisaponis]|uniref:Tape measure protein n=1 Tax=Acinetobacter corruptisaponis TaxID=3045147 RepID=A0ABY8S8E5_9GAMM|nr:tape measure protein [Acinetobacter sp. KCTC 92772]WHP06757.1 tape measure protein [Acinetobacter sp. KCTC 92772]